MGYIKEHGGMASMGDAAALTACLNFAYLQSDKSDSYTVIELGTYLGFTASIMSTTLKDYKNATIYTIDNNKGTKSDTCSGNFKKAKEYLQLCKCTNVNLVIGDSVNIAEKIPDNSIDFLFMDADHSYNYFIKELEAWYPKVKHKGFICGHDYDKKFVEATPAMLNYLKELMKTEGDKDTHGVPLELVGPIHPEYKLDEYDVGKFAPYPRVCMHGGIVLGVNEFFGREPVTFGPYINDKYTSIWCTQVDKGP